MVCHWVFLSQEIFGFLSVLEGGNGLCLLCSLPFLGKGILNWIVRRPIIQIFTVEHCKLNLAKRSAPPRMSTHSRFNMSWENHKPDHYH